MKSLYFKSSRSANLNVNYLKVREKEVVFISKKAGWRELKLAHGLRSSNWGVKLVSMEEPHFKAYDDFTEVIICKSLRSFSDTLLSLKSMIYHNFVINSEISSHLIQHKLPGKLVVDLTDYAFSFGPENFPIEKRYNFDIKVQSYLLSIADGICARDAQLLFERKITNVGKEKELILFPEYCWGAEARERFFEGDNQFFEGSKKGGIAQIGWFGAEIRGETDQGIFSVVESLVGSGQEMHIFTHPRQPQPGSIKFKAFYPNHIELMEKSRKINFYNSVRYDELFKKITTLLLGIKYY